MLKKRGISGRCCLLFLAVLLLAGILWVKVPLWTADSYLVAKEKTVADTRNIKGLFLYRETVVSAPEAGTWCSGCVNGDAIAAGEPAGELKRLNDLNTDPVAMIFSPVSGIYTDTLDGWEPLFRNGFSASLRLKEVFERRQTEKTGLNGFVQRGEPCFKVIDPRGNVDLLLALGATEPNRDTLSLMLNGNRYTATVKKTVTQQGQEYALVTLPNETAFLQSRCVDLQLISGEKRGVAIGREAIFSRFGKTGVYCNQRGKTRYREIEILTQNEEYALVDGVEAGECLLCRDIPIAKKSPM